MKKSTLVFLLGASTLFAFSTAQAGKYGMAGCGIGALAFEDKPGKIQIVAATLNNILVPQTSAITSGTSNCVDSADDHASLYIDVNYAALKKDISRGNGEALTGLARIYQCDDSASFGRALQGQFGQIYDSNAVTAKEVSRRIFETVSQDSALGKSCRVIS